QGAFDLLHRTLPRLDRVGIVPLCPGIGSRQRTPYPSTARQYRHVPRGTHLPADSARHVIPAPYTTIAFGYTRRLYASLRTGDFVSQTTPAVRTFQDLILALQSYWAEQGCVVLQPYDMEMGAGTFHTATFLRAVGPETWNAAYVQPSRRPADGRYGENPNRLQ